MSLESLQEEVETLRIRLTASTQQAATERAGRLTAESLMDSKQEVPRTPSTLGGEHLPTDVSSHHARRSIKLKFPESSKLTRSKVHTSLHFLSSLKLYFELDATPLSEQLLILTTQVEPDTEFGRWYLSESWATFAEFSETSSTHGELVRC